MPSSNLGGTPTVLTEIFHVFSQSLQTNSWKVPWNEHDRFLPIPFVFTKWSSFHIMTLNYHCNWYSVIKWATIQSDPIVVINEAYIITVCACLCEYECVGVYVCGQVHMPFHSNKARQWIIQLKHIPHFPITNNKTQKSADFWAEGSWYFNDERSLCNNLPRTEKCTHENFAHKYMTFM